MDLIYSLERCTQKKSPNLKCLSGAVTLCSISSNNLIAFTTITELDDTSDNTWGCHIYVADLNIPWEAHKIASLDVHVSALEWNLPGVLLLVCDISGGVRIFTSPQHLVSQWSCTYTASFAGEHILSAAFFHNGRKVSLISEKKENTLYNEKFSHLRFACSVRGFGGRPAEGVLVVTATGLLGAALLPRPAPDNIPVPVVTTTESLGATRKHITTIDICYGKNGHFLIAASSGNVNFPIQCYRVSVRKVDEKCVITSQALPSFFLQEFLVNEYKILSHLRWVTREDADSLVIGAVNDTETCLQIWELRETSLPVHPLLGGTSDTHNTILWQHQSQFRYSAKLTSLGTSKLCIYSGASPPSYVLATMSDGTIHCLLRDGLKPVANATITATDLPTGSGVKPSLSYLDTSWLGNVLLTIDTYGQTYLFRLQPATEQGSDLSVSAIMTQLEYCMISGLDCTDVLLSTCVVRNGIHNLLDTIAERLTEAFNRQLSQTQQYYYVQYLYIRTALYRLSPHDQGRATDLTNLLMLHSVSAAFKSLLRPSDLASHERSPADALAAVTSGEAVHSDVDKALMYLEAKEFTVEPSTLQSLQQLIQWVADLALVLLARLPSSPKPSSSSAGYDMVRDSKALNMLRELLVLVRVWGLLRSACLPVFVRSSEGHDSLAHIFRLLSHLAQNPNEPDDSLIDECCQLPNQVIIPQLNQVSPRIALLTPSLHQLKLPLHLEYASEPDSLLYGGDGDTASRKQVVDCIRHAYLGCSPGRVRVCVRCGGRARAPLRPPTGTGGAPRALRAWEQRWLTSCKCGGPWTISANIN